MSAAADHLKSFAPPGVSALAGCPWYVTLVLGIFFFGADPARQWIDVWRYWRGPANPAGHPAYLSRGRRASAPAPQRAPGAEDREAKREAA